MDVERKRILGRAKEEWMELWQPLTTKVGLADFAARFGWLCLNAFMATRLLKSGLLLKGIIGFAGTFQAILQRLMF